jgi:hypothetical protein
MRRRRRVFRPKNGMPAGTAITAFVGVVVPEQVLRPGTAAVQPEKKLMLAVLEDAVRVWRKIGASSSRRGHRVRTELIDWFSSTEQSSPFAFESICSTLGLDAAWARTRLALPGAPVRIAAYRVEHALAPMQLAEAS